MANISHHQFVGLNASGKGHLQKKNPFRESSHYGQEAVDHGKNHTIIEMVDPSTVQSWTPTSHTSPS